MKQEMEYREIPYVKKKVSRILFGTAIQTFMKGEDGTELLDAIYATGVNTFDTARVYKEAESTLGKWIEEKNMRDNIVLLSKCGHPNIFGKKRINEKEMRKDLINSIRYLKTDYIDIYLLHRDDTNVEVGSIVEIFNAMHKEGKIGAFGGSNWSHRRIAEANEYAYKHNLIPFTVSSPNFGLADQVKEPWGGGCVTISGASNQNARAWYEKNEMPVIAYSSLARGMFSGKLKSSEPKKASQVLDRAGMKGFAYPENFERLSRCEELAEEKQCSVAQIAMAYIFNYNMNAFAVVSTTKASRMEENIAAMHIKLAQEELQYLDLERKVR